jgi:hypothetical protein
LQVRKHFDSEGLPEIIGQKVKVLVDLLNKPKIHRKKLKNILSEGIPD